MKRLERLTALLSQLQSRRYTSIEKIVDKFQVSERTVFRDLRALEESGVPVGFEKNKGYYILDGHFLPPLAFTLDEARSFIFVEQLARKYTDKETFRQFSSALEKIKNKLNSDQLEDIEKLQTSVQAYINDAFTPRYLHLAQEACMSREILHLIYENLKGIESERKIVPIGITFYNQSWHIIAWCQMREDYRDFSLARVKNLKATGVFAEKEYLTLDGYIQKLVEADR